MRTPKLNLKYYRAEVTFFFLLKKCNSFVCGRPAWSRDPLARNLVYKRWESWRMRACAHSFTTA